MQFTEVSVQGIRSAVTILRHPETPLRFILFPMLHIGGPEFYAAVARRLRSCDLIVAEGYDGPSSVGLAYAWATRLTRQRAAGPLVHQDIDYASLGVPTVWPEELTAPGRRNRMRLTGWLDVALLAPALTVSMAVGGRGRLLSRTLEVSDDTEPRLPGSFLTRWLIHERDTQLVESLVGICAARGGEPIDVAVVYGAAHMPAVVRGLSERCGYRARRGGEWLTVIDFPLDLDHTTGVEVTPVRRPRRVPSGAQAPSAAAGSPTWAPMAAAAQAVWINHVGATLTDPPARRAELVRALIVTSTGLSALGQCSAGLAVADDAVDLAEELSQSSPEAHHLTYAAALMNLSARLADIGRPDDARVVLSEAADSYRAARAVS
jgi:hypothetical protein